MEQTVDKPLIRLVFHVKHLVLRFCNALLLFCNTSTLLTNSSLSVLPSLVFVGCVVAWSGAAGSARYAARLELDGASSDRRGPFAGGLMGLLLEPVLLPHPRVGHGHNLCSVKRLKIE